MSDSKKSRSSSQPAAKEEVVRLLPLGGMDEDGKNMLVIEIDEDIYICETGLKFPDAKSALGIECIVPDFSWLKERKDKVKGILVTHGHDDVIGALPYLLEEISADVYVTPFTAHVVHDLLKAHHISGVRIKSVKRDDTRKIGGRQVIFFPVTHSYPETYGFGIKTDHGWIVYSGEFIMDFDDAYEVFKGDIAFANRFKKEGVLILLSDSKGAERPLHTSPKHRVTPSFDEVLNRYEHSRVFVEIYTQSVYRIQELIECCIEHRRKICFYTKELQNLVAGLQSITRAVPDDLVVPASEINSLENVVVIISGQGRPLFHLMSNICNDEVPDISIRPSDVIIAATPLVPGVEKDFKQMENDIYKRDGTIIKIDRNVLGMHPSKEDLKMVIFMTEPKYYIPIKGEYRMLCANAMLAEEMGIAPDRIVLLDNGDIAKFVNGQLVSVSDHIDLHDSMIDGSADWDMAGVVLKDREILSTDGVLICAIGLDSKTKKVINGPDIQSRGLVYVRDAEYLTKEVMKIMEDTIKEMVENKTYDNMECRAAIREKASRYIFKTTAKRPMVLPVILEINPHSAS